MVALGEWPSLPVILAAGLLVSSPLPFPSTPLGVQLLSQPADAVHKGLFRWRPSFIFAALALRHSYPLSGSPGLVSSALPLPRRGCTPGRACSHQRTCCSPGPEPCLSLIFLSPHSVCSGPAPCVLGCSFPEHHLFSSSPALHALFFACSGFPTCPTQLQCVSPGEGQGSPLI